MDISWEDLLGKRVRPPWIPELESKTDLKHIDPEFTGEHISESLGKSLANTNSYHNGADFAGFTYVPESNINL